MEKMKAIRLDDQQMIKISNMIKKEESAVNKINSKRKEQNDHVNALYHRLESLEGLLLCSLLPLSPFYLCVFVTEILNFTGYAAIPQEKVADWNFFRIATYFSIAILILVFTIYKILKKKYQKEKSDLDQYKKEHLNLLLRNDMILIRHYELPNDTYLPFGQLDAFLYQDIAFLKINEVHGETCFWTLQKKKKKTIYRYYFHGKNYDISIKNKDKDNRIIRNGSEEWIAVDLTMRLSQSSASELYEAIYSQFRKGIR